MSATSKPVFDVNVKFFRASGVWQYIKQEKYGFTLGFVHTSAIILMIIYIFSQIINAITSGYEFSLVTEKISVNLTILEGMVKMLFYISKREELNILTGVFKQDFLACSKQNGEKTKSIMNRSAKLINAGVKAFVIMIYSTITVWNVVPIIKCLFQGKCDDWHIIPLWYPFEPNYVVMYLFEFCVMTYTATLLYTVNCLFSSLALSVSAQFRILQLSLSKIEANGLKALKLNKWEKVLLLHNYPETEFTEAQYISYKINKVKKQDRMLLLLKECLKDHQKLLCCCKKLEETYNPMFLFQMLVSTVTICLVLVQLNVNLSSGEEVSIAAMNKFIMYMVFCLMELLIYSIGGQMVYDQSGGVHRSLYETGWSEANPSFRTCVFIALTRCNKQESLTAGKFYNVGLASFTQIVKASYSYFTFLRGSQTKAHGGTIRTSL